MNIQQIEDIREDLKDKILGLNMLKLQLHNAVEDRNLSSIIAHYYMINEYEGIISDLGKEIDNYSLLN